MNKHQGQMQDLLISPRCLWSFFPCLLNVLFFFWLLNVAGMDSPSTNRKMTHTGCTKLAIVQLSFAAASSNLAGRL